MPCGCRGTNSEPRRMSTTTNRPQPRPGRGSADIPATDTTSADYFAQTPQWDGNKTTPAQTPEAG